MFDFGMRFKSKLFRVYNQEERDHRTEERAAHNPYCYRKEVCHQSLSLISAVKNGGARIHFYESSGTSPPKLDLDAIILTIFSRFILNAV